MSGAGGVQIKKKNTGIRTQQPQPHFPRVGVQFRSAGLSRKPATQSPQGRHPSCVPLEQQSAAGGNGGGSWAGVVVSGAVGGVVVVSGATAAMIETKADTKHFFRTNNLQDLQHKQFADAQCCQFYRSMCYTKHHRDKWHHHWKTLSHAHQCQIILIATIHNRL